MSKPSGADTPLDATVPEASHTPRAGRTWRAALALSARMLTAMLTMLVLAFGMAAVMWVLAHGEAFSNWLMRQLPGVTVVNARGALLGDFSAARIDVALPRGGRLWLVSPRWQGLQLVWDASAKYGLGLRAESLTADHMELAWVSNPGSAPTKAPDNLRLPLSVNVPVVAVGEARSTLWGTPIRQLRLSVQLREAEHHLQVQSMHWAGWQLGPMGMVARLGVAAPMPVQLSVSAVAASAVGVSAPASAVATIGKATANQALVASPGELRLQLQGPLADLRLNGSARWAESHGDEQTDEQTLVLDARLQPFAVWPLAQAHVVAHALDLSALMPAHRDVGTTASKAVSHALPRTRLDGRLTLTPRGTQALELDIDLHNPVAAPWDTGGLPLLSVQGQVVAPTAQRVVQSGAQSAHAGQAANGAKNAQSGMPDAWRDTRANLRLTMPSLPGQPPATVTLQGVWGTVNGSHQATDPVRLTLSGVQAQALHAAAPPVLLNGSIKLQPAWGALITDVPGLVGVSAQITGSYGRLHARKVPIASDGTESVASAGRRLRVIQDHAIAADLEGEWRPDVWAVRTLSLRSNTGGQGGEARLSDARLTWRDSNTWQAEGAVNIEQFDPVVWLPWPAKASGHNSLSAQGSFKLDNRGLGLVDLSLTPSTLAGLPLHGELHWHATEAAAMQIQADLDLAGNVLHASGQGQTKQPMDAAWRVQVSAAQLQALEPLAPLIGLQRLKGALLLDAHWQGGWLPRSANGTFSASGLSWAQAVAGGLKGSASLASAQGEWRWGWPAAADQTAAASSLGVLSYAGNGATMGNSPIQARLAVQAFQGAGVQIDHGLATLEGIPSDHRLRIESDGRMKMRGGATGGDATSVQAAAQAVHLSVSMDGSWQAEDDHFAWRGRLSRASVIQGGAPPGSPALLDVQPTDIVWQRSPQGQSLQVQRTSLMAMGADITLERLHWQTAAGAETQGTDALDLMLHLTPLKVPQWLARWQPQAGWGGDLTVAGQVRVLQQPGKPLEVDAELARQAGDLTLSEPTVEGQSAQRMGLREARASVTVRNGLWTFQQALDGRVLGRLSGRQTLQARDPGAWPAADAPLSGEVDVQVSSLRPLATWAPAGWRLNGQLQGHAQVGGTLGHPSWTGWLQGDQLALSQSLLGVHLSDGQLRIDLEGNRARLTRFVATDGAQAGAHGAPQPGRLFADGEATLGSAGAAPQLQLHVQAERFAAMQRIDRRVVLSGDTQTSFSADTLRVRGRILIDEGLIDISHSSAPTLGDDVTVHRRPGQPDHPDVSEAASADGNGAASPTRGVGQAQRKVDADIGLDLGQQLRIKGHGLDGMLVGRLQMTTPMSKPSIQGAVKLQQGTFSAYGQKLRIERSTITFTGLIDNPRLDILAMRPPSPAADESDVRVGVRITGTALDPRIRLYSEPALTETEQLSWLVLGRAPSGLGGADIGLLQSAAVALLSGESREGPTDKIIGLLGLDTLSVSQTEGTVRDTVINVGKQVSRHWYVGYEHNLNVTGGNLQLIYSLAQRFKLRAQAGGDNAIDLIWQWRWD